MAPNLALGVVNINQIYVNVYTVRHVARMNKWPSQSCMAQFLQALHNWNHVSSWVGGSLILQWVQKCVLCDMGTRLDGDLGTRVGQCIVYDLQPSCSVKWETTLAGELKATQHQNVEFPNQLRYSMTLTCQ